MTRGWRTWEGVVTEILSTHDGGGKDMRKCNVVDVVHGIRKKES